MPKTPRKAKEHNGQQMEPALYGKPAHPATTHMELKAWLKKSPPLPLHGIFPAYRQLAREGELAKVVDRVTLDTSPYETVILRSVLYGAVEGGHTEIVRFVLHLVHPGRLRLSEPKEQCEERSAFRNSERAAWDALIDLAEKELKGAAEDEERTARIIGLCEYLRKARSEADKEADSFLKK